MQRYQPPPATKDATGQFAELSRVLDSQPALAFKPETATALSVAPGEIKRLSPRSGGQTVVLPAAVASNAGASIALFVSGLGALTVAPVSGTINGASQLVFAAGTFSLELFSDGERWLTPGLSTTTIDALAGAGLARNGTALDVTGSTSIVVTGDQVTRAALTGEVTASANANGTTVTRSTDFSTTPWTGGHKFNADVKLGTLHTEASVSGAFSITRTAGAMRVLITTTADATLSTISGCADGIPLFVEHAEASGAPNTLTVTHDSSTANAFACPGGVDMLVISRGGFICMGRGTNWKVVANVV